MLPVGEDLYARGFALYSVADDKEWGLIDCISFVAMEDRGITKALSADEHFRQREYLPLLTDADD